MNERYNRNSYPYEGLERQLAGAIPPRVSRHEYLAQRIIRELREEVIAQRRCSIGVDGEVVLHRALAEIARRHKRDARARIGNPALLALGVAEKCGRQLMQELLSVEPQPAKATEA